MSVALITIAEAAKVLAISPSTVRRLIITGEIVGVRIRRTIRIEQSEVQAFIGRSRIKPLSLPTIGLSGRTILVDGKTVAMRKTQKR